MTKITVCLYLCTQKDIYEKAFFWQNLIFATLSMHVHNHMRIPWDRDRGGRRVYCARAWADVPWHRQNRAFLFLSRYVKHRGWSVRLFTCFLLSRARRKAFLTAPPGQCQQESAPEPPEEEQQMETQQGGKHHLEAPTELSHYKK